MILDATDSTLKLNGTHTLLQSLFFFASLPYVCLVDRLVFTHYAGKGPTGLTGQMITGLRSLKETALGVKISSPPTSNVGSPGSQEAGATPVHIVADIHGYSFSKTD